MKMSLNLRCANKFRHSIQPLLCRLTNGSQFAGKYSSWFWLLLCFDLYPSFLFFFFGVFSSPQMDLQCSVLGCHCWLASQKTDTETEYVTENSFGLTQEKKRESINIGPWEKWDSMQSRGSMRISDKNGTQWGIFTLSSTSSIGLSLARTAQEAPVDDHQMQEALPAPVGSTLLNLVQLHASSLFYLSLWIYSNKYFQYFTFMAKPKQM